MTTPVILLVEDEPFIREATAEVLTRSGCTVLEVETAIEAFAALNEREDIAVLVADVNLPGSVNGLEIGKLAMHARPSLRIILTSGGDFPANTQIPPNALFVPKPYRPAAICAAVRGDTLSETAAD